MGSFNINERILLIMQSGTCFLKKLQDNACSFDTCIILGEVFYVQLFLDFNILNLKKILILDIGFDLNNLWSDSLSFTILNEIPENYSGCIIFCGLDKSLENKYSRICDYNFFDIESIRNNGTFIHDGTTYIVDDVKYVASNPEYMKRAYRGVSEKLDVYLQELSKAPSGRHVDKKGQICLWNYHSRYINQSDGRRVTLNVSESPSKIIHVFGDSRVSGYMLEDSHLFSNILQTLFNENKKNYAVFNYGIPGRDIERMQYQVNHASIKKGDIVFIMTGCYEYRIQSYERQLQFAYHVKKIKDLCLRIGAEFLYINLPVSVEMLPISEDEKIISDLYRHYKFKEYSFDVVEKYKRFLLMTLESYGIRCYDMATAFNMPHSDLLFINMHHYSPAGNLVIAKALFDLVNLLEVNLVGSTIVKKMYNKANKTSRLYVKTQLKQYGFFCRTKIHFGSIRKIGIKHFFFRLYVWLDGLYKEMIKKRGKHAIYGSIVMNANPFTLGHRYLVEYASKEVDHLYVFVLEEDKSEISYDDRLHMVFYGCKDIKNVSVTSGGGDVISNTTFPEYFMKKELQSAEINAYKDIRRFALKIASVRNITRRYFGEEPFDNVTRQYNKQMKKYFPEFDIEAVEIPRKTIGDKVISATKVRAALSSNNWGVISEMVPKSTYKYLKWMRKEKLF